MSKARLSEILRLAVPALAGVFVVGVLALGKTAVAPPDCAGCHTSETFVSQTAASGHADIACARCHVPADPASRVGFASRVVFGMQLKVAPGDRASATVPDATCVSCHRDIYERPSDSKGKRIDHAQCAEDRRCTDCHSGVAHGSAVRWRRTSQMSDCLRCHATDEVRRDCDTCHAAKTPRERLGVGAWQTTHGANWRTTHGMGDLATCAACHAKGYCVRCHGTNLPHSESFVRTHGAEATSPAAKCDSCHRKQSFCDSCHGTEMPHPSGFTERHVTIAKSAEDKACLRCHVQSDCVGCHVKHVHPGGARPASNTVSAEVPR